MNFDTNNYIVMSGGGACRGDQFAIHEVKNNNGKMGEIVSFADGRGDINEVAQKYIEKGFDPDKIVMNGQLASDVFELSAKENKEKQDKPKMELFGQEGNIISNRDAALRTLMYLNMNPFASATAFLLDKDLSATYRNIRENNLKKKQGIN